MNQCLHVDRDGDRCPKEALYMWMEAGEWVWSCLRHKRNLHKANRW